MRALRGFRNSASRPAARPTHLEATSHGHEGDIVLPSKLNYTVPGYETLIDANPPSTIHTKTKGLPGHTNVTFVSEDLIVKWGHDVKIIEGQCLWYISEHRHKLITNPTIKPSKVFPKVFAEPFGWRTSEETGMTYIYMERLPGEPMSSLLERDKIDKKEQDDICKQLQRILKQLRAQVPKKHRQPSGCQNNPPHHSFYCRVYPFRGLGERFEGEDWSVVELQAKYRGHRARPGMTEYVFSTGDFVAENVLVRRDSKGQYEVTAIVDLELCGFYPQDSDDHVFKQLENGTFGDIWRPE